MNFILSLILSSLLIFSCSHHSEHEHKKGLNDNFTDPNLDVGKWVDGFENNDRDVFQNRDLIVKALKLKPGNCVADIGAGTGGFLPQLNKMVGEKGEVYAVEISDGFIEYMDQRVRIEKLSRVKVVKGGIHSSNLPDSSCDTLLLVDVYHHLDNPNEMLKDFHRVLKPQGKLAIVDFNKVEGISRAWVIKHMKQTKEEIKNTIVQEGFKFGREPNIPFEENFMMIFEKVTQ